MRTTCTPGANAVVAMDAGLNPMQIGAAIERRMAGTDGVMLPYQLFADAKGAQPWAITDWAARGRSIIPAFHPTTGVLYGRIDPAMNLPAGNYSDTVTVSFTF
jgi:spore coat protein U-like protein